MHEIELGQAMKEGMRRLGSGVCVLSSQTEQTRHAMTVSSVTSVSAEPASLLVCIHEQTAMYTHIDNKGDKLVINVLSSDQVDVSNACAGMSEGESRFDIGDWRQGFDEQPYLHDAQAVFFCHADQMFQYGTHKIVIATIEHVMIDEGDVKPLIYVDGGYGTNSPL